MNASIDLINMLPHTSHRLQPLDINIFGPLKRNLTKHLENQLQHDSRRLQRVEWMEAFIKARRDSFRLSSIESSFRSAGIYPFDPLEVLLKLDPPLPLLSSTPPPTDGPIDLDDSLLLSSPPDGISLRQLKNQVESVISRSNLESPTKRYLKRSQTLLEKVVSENALLRRSNAEKDTLLEVRRTRKKGKRVAIQGKHVLSTAEILKIVENAEKEVPKKKQGKKRKLQTPTPESSIGEEETSEDELLGA
jgi:hypothetical protein